MKTLLDVTRAAAGPSKLDGNTLSGIVIPYNKVADLGGGMKEVIRPGAVADFLRSNPKIGAIMEHDAKWLLGCTADATLKLTDTEEALLYEITLPDTSYANDLRSFMKANPSAYGASWHMIVPAEGYDYQFGDDGTSLCEITQIRSMREITITAFPVYVDTTAMLRSVQQLRSEKASNMAAVAVDMCKLRLLV